MSRHCGLNEDRLEWGSSDERAYTKEESWDYPKVWWRSQVMESEQEDWSPASVLLQDLG